MKIFRTRVWFVGLFLVILENIFFSSVFTQTTVTPSSFSTTLLSEERAGFGSIVTTRPKSIPKIDVVFAIDITGSMDMEFGLNRKKDDFI